MLSRSNPSLEKKEKTHKVGTDPTVCEDMHTARTLVGGGRHVVGTVRVHAGRWTPLEQRLLDRLYFRCANRRKADQIADSITAPTLHIDCRVSVSRDFLPTAKNPLLAHTIIKPAAIYVLR